jgi:hypothetical protein
VRGFRRTVALLAAALFAGSLVGCTRDQAAAPTLPEAPASTGPATASPTPSGTARESAEPGADLVRVTSQPPGGRAAARVYADYVRFWQRDMLALRTNDLRGSGAVAYLFPPQLQNTTAYLGKQRRAGIHTEGTIGIAPLATAVRARSAVIQDCLDQSTSYDIDRSGKHISPSPPHLPLTVSMQLGADNRWKVSNLGRRGGTC